MAVSKSTRKPSPTTLREIVRSLAAPDPFSAPHRRVLREAMRLMAEHGYAGASLRTLARRLRMSQPSLYHYFSSKQELVEQIIRLYAARAMRLNADALPALTLEQGLRLSLRRIADNYADPEHVTFMRFLLALSLERPELRELGQRLLVERGASYVQRFVELYVESGVLLAEDARPLVELLLAAQGMYLLGRNVLFGDHSDREDEDRFADFLIDTAVRGVKSRARARRAKSGARDVSPR